MMIPLLLIALQGATPAATSQPVSPDAAEHAADPRNRMICKRFVETGSLVRGTRVCKTKADWDRDRDNIRQLNPTASCSATGQGGRCQ